MKGQLLHVYISACECERTACTVIYDYLQASMRLPHDVIHIHWAIGALAETKWWALHTFVFTVMYSTSS